jgi:hypothetical protein
LEKPFSVNRHTQSVWLSFHDMIVSKDEESTKSFFSTKKLENRRTLIQIENKHESQVVTFDVGKYFEVYVREVLKDSSSQKEILGPIAAQW